MAARLLSLRTVADMVEYTPKTIRKWVDEGYFPAPVEMPNGDKRWHRRAVLAWIELRPARTVKRNIEGTEGNEGE